MNLRIVTEAEPPSAAIEEIRFDDAFRTYARYVGRIAYRLTANQDDAEEITQEVFLRLAGKIDGIESHLHLKRWLSQVTVRVAQRYGERFRFWRKLRDPNIGIPDLLSVRADTSAEDRLAVVELYRTLSRLPFAQRSVWVLAHAEGLSLDEIASCCGISKATVKRRLAAATTAVKKHDMKAGEA